MYNGREREIITNRKAKKFTTRTNCKEALGAARGETPQGKRPAKGAVRMEGALRAERKESRAKKLVQDGDGCGILLSIRDFEEVV